MAKKLKGDYFYLSANDLITGDVIYLGKKEWSKDTSWWGRIKTAKFLFFLPGGGIYPWEKLKNSIEKLKKSLKNQWETMPEVIISSSTKRTGKKELFEFISKHL